jgi:hypothetical protein
MLASASRPEAKGLNALQIPGTTDLGGGMLHEGQWQIVRLYAASVVRHTNEARASIIDLNDNPPCSCIDGIFYELLDG